LREYLYVTLGGNRGGEWKTYRNLLLTMVIGGLWHGANWTFIVWGFLHGGGLAVTRWFQRNVERGGSAALAFVKMVVVFAVGLAIHKAAFARIGAFGGAWLHLTFAWCYVTPLWAATTAWLTIDKAPAIKESRAPVGVRSAAGPARLACCALTVLTLLAIWRGPQMLWVPLLVSWFGTAILGDVFETAPSFESAVNWLPWAARRGLAMLLTFHYVCFAWIFFRATSFEKARDVLAQIGKFATDHVNLLPPFVFALGVAALAHLFPPGTFRWVREKFMALPAPAQAAVLVGCALILRKLANPVVVPFIYFQF
jgi:D-alanyl-lipoteichoic acid acyltransferase DltB (MBOAT superfamily)